MSAVHNNNNNNKKLHLPDEKQNPFAAPNVENKTAIGMMMYALSPRTLFPQSWNKKYT